MQLDSDMEQVLKRLPHIDLTRKTPGEEPSFPRVLLTPEPTSGEGDFDLTPLLNAVGAEPLYISAHAKVKKGTKK